MTSVPGFYVRIDIDDIVASGTVHHPVDVDHIKCHESLTFVDLYTSLRTPYTAAIDERLTAAVQDRLHLLSSTTQVLFRWPWIIGPSDDDHSDGIDRWLERLTSRDGGESVIAPGINTGIIQHGVGRAPIVHWSNVSPTSEAIVLEQARAIELLTLLRRSNAIWEPTTYHYSLPSGEHTDVFVRLADAIQTPQDAYAISTWLADRLRRGTSIVVDTGGLTPILVQLESFSTQFGLGIGPAVILSEYPVGRSAVRQAVENAASELQAHVMGIVSVSSSGTVLRTLADELERLSSYTGPDVTLDLLVDRTYGTDTPDKPSNPNVISWLRLHRPTDVGQSGACDHCKSAEKAQLVAIDPRTYGSMSLPGPYLVMPDTDYATAAQPLWTRIAKYGGCAIETNPHPASKMARGKRTPLPVQLILDIVCQPEGLQPLMKQRCKGLSLPDDIAHTALVVVEERDISTVTLSYPDEPVVANLGESVDVVLREMGVSDRVSIVAAQDTAKLSRCIANLDGNDSVLVFSWGSVTGLTIRHLKLTVADVLREHGKDVPINGLVFHSRTSSPSEWTALANQFRPGSLVTLWTSCFSWSSPLADEDRLLDRSDLNGLESARALAFLEERLQFLGLHATHSESEDDWSPRFKDQGGPQPTHVFWGMSVAGIHQAQVRGRSLYGTELDCLSAYGAIGAVVNYTRLSARPEAAPRWVMFDVGRIVRSYFDAIIMCSILRWLQPGELWWGTETGDADAVRDSVAFLLNQAIDVDEQVLLVPELLLAAAQGKIPVLAHDIVRSRANEIRSEWPQDDRYAAAHGAVELGLALLDPG